MLQLSKISLKPPSGRPRRRPWPRAEREVRGEREQPSCDESGRSVSDVGYYVERYGLVCLERGERRRIAPKVMHDRVELDLPIR
jgi:hypothetical protein